jgi:ParB-like chromosome segregation protein Spo0J
MTTRYDYEVHPLAALFPPLSDEKFEELEADIGKNGQLEPIVINRQNQLIDGRNRLRVCESLSITPRTILFDDVRNIGGMSEADYIWSKNVLRRQLTDDQRAAIAVKWSDTEKEAAKLRQVAGLKKGERKPVVADSPQRGKTRTTLAKKANVSEHKIRQAEQAAKQGCEILAGVIAGIEPLKDTLKKAQGKKPTYKPKTPEQRNAANARLWLIKTLNDFERLNVNAVDSTEVQNVLSAANLEILRNCRDWLNKVAASFLDHSDKPKPQPTTEAHVQ